MRRIAACLLALTLLLSMTACDYAELSNVVFVIGIAIDPVENDEKSYNITIELIAMDKAGNDGKYESVNITTPGKTIFSALEHMILLTSGRLVYSHCEIIVIQEDLARKGIDGFVDSFYQSDEFPLTSAVMIAHGASAKDILTADPLTMQAQAFEIDATISHENALQHFTKHTLHEIFSNIHHNPPLVSTVLALQSEKTENKTATAVSGGFLMVGDTAIQFLEEEQMSYVLLLGGRIDRMLVPIPLPDEGGYIDVILAKSEVATNPVVVDGTIQTDVRIDMTLTAADIMPDSAKDLDLVAHIEGVMNQRFTDIMARIYGEWNCDMLNLLVALGRHHPRQMDELMAAGVTPNSYRLQVNTTIHERPNDLMEE